MPYEWIPSPAASEAHLRLRPHRSLPRTGFVWFIAATAGMIALPLIPLVGVAAFWGLLPFLLLAVAAIWWALQRNNRDREIIEDLVIRPDSMRLVRLGPHGKRAEWQANPYWVTPVLHKTGGPVPNYLTLRGAAREVELGAFLTDNERVALCSEISIRLHQLK